MAGSIDQLRFFRLRGGYADGGSAATILTIPDNGGTSPVELNGAELSLGTGLAMDSGWQRLFQFVCCGRPLCAGELTVRSAGGTLGVRFRNFNLPADRDLQLFNTSTSLYYEVVAQTPATGPNIIIVNVDDMVGGQHFGFEGRDCLTPTAGFAGGQRHQFYGSVCGVDGLRPVALFADDGPLGIAQHQRKFHRQISIEYAGAFRGVGYGVGRRW